MSTPPRPDLTATASKPDVLVRLRSVRDIYSTHPLAYDTAMDAIAVIAALRDIRDSQRATIRDLQRELADLRQEEGR